MSPLCKLGRLTDPSAWAGDVNMLYREENVPYYIPDKKYSQRERYPTKEMEDGEILMRVSEVIITIQLVILTCQTNLYKIEGC